MSVLFFLLPFLFSLPPHKPGSRQQTAALNQRPKGIPVITLRPLYCWTRREEEQQPDHCSAANLDKNNWTEVCVETHRECEKPALQTWPDNLRLCVQHLNLFILLVIHNTSSMSKIFVEFHLFLIFLANLDTWTSSSWRIRSRNQWGFP